MWHFLSYRNSWLQELSETYRTFFNWLYSAWKTWLALLRSSALYGNAA